MEDDQDTEGAEPTVTPSRQERIDQMKATLARAQADGSTELSKSETEELLQWASIEHAAVYHLISQAQRVIGALHPSTHHDSERADTEASMYLLEAAAQLSQDCGVPKDVLVKSLMVYLGDRNRVAPPEADEQDDFDNLLFGSAN